MFAFAYKNHIFSGKQEQKPTSLTTILGNMCCIVGEISICPIKLDQAMTFLLPSSL